MDWGEWLPSISHADLRDEWLIPPAKHFHESQDFRPALDTLGQMIQEETLHLGGERLSTHFMTDEVEEHFGAIRVFRLAHNHSVAQAGFDWADADSTFEVF